MNKKKEGLFKGASVAELYSKFGVVLILILCLIIGTILSPEIPYRLQPDERSAKCRRLRNHCTRHDPTANWRRC